MARLSRGAVVTRGHRYAVVWTHDAAGLVLLPIVPAEAERLSHVLIEGSEFFACGAPIAHAAVWVSPLRLSSDTGQSQIGQAPGGLMCRIVQTVVRMAAEQAAHDKWGGDRAHRAREHRSSVRMVG